ncbi:hypothetical protein BGZ98_005526, partial [Dissophora globulifera]
DSEHDKRGDRDDTKSSSFASKSSGNGGGDNDFDININNIDGDFNIDGDGDNKQDDVSDKGGYQETDGIRDDEYMNDEDEEGEDDEDVDEPLSRWRRKGASNPAKSLPPKLLERPSNNENEVPDHFSEEDQQEVEGDIFSASTRGSDAGGEPCTDFDFDYSSDSNSSCGSEVDALRKASGLNKKLQPKGLQQVQNPDEDKHPNAHDWYKNILDDTHFQHRTVEKTSPYRSVDYNHRYNWMHPEAPLRLENDRRQAGIAACLNIIKEVQFANRFQDECCLQCVGDEIDDHSDADAVCSVCLKPKLDTTNIELLHDLRVREAQQYLKGQGAVLDPPESEEIQTRCYWCGVLLVDKDDGSIDDFLAWARVDIEGVGPLPSLYGFDHQQKRLCLHCISECGALLKEKRRFQSCYELTALALPFGCNNCGVRESVAFRPSVDRDFKEREGLDPNAPMYNSARFEELRDAILDCIDRSGIRWDRVANHPKANPQFQYTAHGLLNHWTFLCNVPTSPVLPTFMLLQHNHLTRRNQDWELYTCTARTPTQAALYFARFVDLYKKRPMTYLYIRQLEGWNIPEPRGDSWEDLSSGLETFDQLKDRIRRSIQKEAVESTVDKQTKLEASYEQAKKDLKDSVRDIMGRYPLNKAGRAPWPAKEQERTRWKAQMKYLLGPENKALLRQLHWDPEENQRYFTEYRSAKDYARDPRRPKFEHRYRSLRRRISSREFYGGRPRADYKHLMQVLSQPRTRVITRVAAARVMKDKGLVRGIAGWAPANPPEPRTKMLPRWAQENAREVVKKSIEDNRLLHLHRRHLMYRRIRRLKAEITKKSRHSRRNLEHNLSRQERSVILALAKRIDGIAAARGHASRSWEECVLMARRIYFEDRGSVDSDAQRSEVFQSEVHAQNIATGLVKSIDGAIRFLRPASLRLVAGDRPQISKTTDHAQLQFIEHALEIDRASTQDLKPFAALSKHRTYGDGETLLDRPIFQERMDLRPVFDTEVTPSAEYPIHLLPSEYQVHVFQSVLVPELRTVNVRLVRTERYKRQGDSIQGGGPVAVPKVINRDNTRGFYRESDDAVRPDPGDEISPKVRPDRQHTLEAILEDADVIERVQRREPSVLIKAKTKTNMQDAGSIETWQPISVEPLVTGDYVKDEDLVRRLRMSLPLRTTAAYEKSRKTATDWSTIRAQERHPRRHITPRDLRDIQEALSEITDFGPKSLQLFERRLHRVDFEPFMDEEVIQKEIRVTKASRQAQLDSSETLKAASSDPAVASFLDSLAFWRAESNFMRRYCTRPGFWLSQAEDGLRALSTASLSTRPQTLETCTRTSASQDVVAEDDLGERLETTEEEKVEESEDEDVVGGWSDDDLDMNDDKQDDQTNNARMIKEGEATSVAAATTDATGRVDLDAVSSYKVEELYRQEKIKNARLLGGFAGALRSTSVSTWKRSLKRRLSSLTGTSSDEGDEDSEVGFEVYSTPSTRAMKRVRHQATGLWQIRRSSDGNTNTDTDSIRGRRRTADAILGEIEIEGSDSDSSS